MAYISLPDFVVEKCAVRARAAGCDTETFIAQALAAKLDDLDEVISSLQETE